MTCNIISAVIAFEIKREARKKAFLLMIVLVILPVMAAVVVRLFTGREIGGERLWALLFGADLGSSALTGLIASIGIVGWSWLVGVMYGGDLFASDIREGLLQLFFLRPKGRIYYVLGKMLAVGIFLTSFFAVAGVFTLVAGLILGGWQRDWWLAPVLGFLLGLGVYPIVLASSLFGILTRSPILGMILGAAAYILTGVAVSLGMSIVLVSQGIANIEAWKDYMEGSIILSGYIPFLAGTQLPLIFYYYITLENTFTPIPLPSIGGASQVAVTLDLTPSDVLPLYLGSTLIGTLVLFALNTWAIRRLEL
ncbi:MAG: AsmA family protein [Aeropyrum sp.]|nr:AsmA family protein [Aeropyrum sp.]